MEGNVFDVFRVLSLVLVWGIPALLVVAVVAFAAVAPGAILAGAIISLWEAVNGKLRRSAAPALGKRP